MTSYKQSIVANKVAYLAMWEGERIPVAMGYVMTQGILGSDSIEDVSRIAEKFTYKI